MQKVYICTPLKYACYNYGSILLNFMDFTYYLGKLRSISRDRSCPLGCPLLAGTLPAEHPHPPGALLSKVGALDKSVYHIHGISQEKVEFPALYGPKLPHFLYTFLYLSCNFSKKVYTMVDLSYMLISGGTKSKPGCPGFSYQAEGQGSVSIVKCMPS